MRYVNLFFTPHLGPLPSQQSPLFLFWNFLMTSVSHTFAFHESNVSQLKIDTCSVLVVLVPLVLSHTPTCACCCRCWRRGGRRGGCHHRWSHRCLLQQVRKNNRVYHTSANSVPTLIWHVYFRGIFHHACFTLTYRNWKLFRSCFLQIFHLMILRKSSNPF